MVSALYIRKDSYYKRMRGVRAWDARRDARKWIAYWQSKLEIPANKSPQQHLADLRWTGGLDG